MDADDQSRIATLYRMDMLVSTGKRKERDATGEAGIEHTKVYCCNPPKSPGIFPTAKSYAQTTIEETSFYR